MFSGASADAPRCATIKTPAFAIAPIAKTILWRGWKSGLTRQEGVRLGAEALVYAGLMDNGTSDFRAGVVPSLATVTDTGFSWVPVEEVDAAANEVMADVRARGVVR